MANKTETKPPFWSSLPGILTATGGVIVAMTGLITALYSTGIFGAKPAPNTAPTPSSPVALFSTPAPTPAPSLKDESDEYKQLAGTWEVIEEQPADTGGNKITWIYNATVSGNQVTFKGKISAINGQTDLPPDKKGTSVTSILTIKDSMAIGKLRQKDPGGSVIESPQSIVLDDDLASFQGTLIVSGHKCILTGRKQL